MSVERRDILEWVEKFSLAQGNAATRESVLKEIEGRYGHLLSGSRFAHTWHQTATSCATELRRKGKLQGKPYYWRHV
jgi:hypothetical protein